MISMQYSFVLPADYDMSVIDRRIAEKGSMTDGFPGLVFKAYLSARKGERGASDNRYAPFYLWDGPAGMNDFLSGPGFVALTQSFGWPSVATWSVWHAELAPGIERARFATSERLAIAPHTGLEQLRAAETALAQSCVSEAKALAAVAGYEPTTWTLVRFRLWEELPLELAKGAAVYRVGHVSR
ncbi:DUF4865 family protein [Massilia agilis]|uniref:DUF4865 family protein n=1 Tax=Massilia agilis TaxID=1811226 RepID=A0ABT2D5T0_9BURK|nr:DUF4865 family protein [Massilia agilis]MCS0806624.1 DUF4865 family protein [Massilia agilis]